MARVRSLRPEIESIIGRRMDHDEQVQDASFFTQLAATVPKPQRIEVAIAVTFSAFGGLFTVWSTAPDEIPDPVVRHVIRAVEEHGFRYVASESLSETYSGDNQMFQGSDWGYRFFSYL